MERRASPPAQAEHQLARL